MRWFFTDPKTGRVVIAQWPNVPLWIFFAASAVKRLLDAVADPSAAVRAPLTLVATGALVVWAVDEVVRGRSPFRRVLGAVVLAGVVTRFWRQ